jgi:hypothetical protein
MKLKTTNDSNRLKILSLIISICNFCILIVYGVLSHLLSINEIFIVCSCSIFAIILLFGIWKFTKTKPAFVVRFERWQYEIFKTEEKYTSITLVGAYKAVFVFIYILLLLLFNLLTIKFITIADMLFIIAILCVVPLFEGYIDYKQYNSTKLEE